MRFNFELGKPLIGFKINVYQLCYAFDFVNPCVALKLSTIHVDKIPK